MRTREEIKEEVRRFNTWTRCEHFDDGTSWYYHHEELLSVHQSVDVPPREDRKLVSVNERAKGVIRLRPAESIKDISLIESVPRTLPVEIDWKKHRIITLEFDGMKRVIGIYPKLKASEIELLKSGPDQYDSISLDGRRFYLKGRKVGEYVDLKGPLSADTLNGPGNA